MANSPSIVMASLSDDQLKKSIDSLVTHVDEAMKKMVQSTNNAVGEMEAKLKSLGSLKIDSGSSNDGGTGRRTQQHEKLTKAVNDASEAVSRETQKLQDLQQSLSGASDREQNFISQKERAAGTIAQENELLQRQEQELANLKNQQSSFSGTNQQTTASIEKQREAVANLKNEVKYWQSIVSQLQSGDKKTRFNNLWIGDTTSKQGHDILDVANKLYSIMQKLGMEAEKGSASTGQAVKVVEQLAKYYKISREEAEKLVMSVQESPLARGKFTTHYDTRFGLDNLTMQKKDAEDSALRLLIAQSKLERQTDDLALANKRLADSENSSTQSSQQKAQIDAQVAAKEKEIAETKGRIAAATKEQSEAEKNASQAAKEKANIQSQVANQEKQVAEAKKQLTAATQHHTEAETKSSRTTKEKTMTLDQQASAINTAVQSEKKYTDEVLRQAAAIRSSKEWQEKGHVVVGDTNYYDKERANVSKRDKQLLLSLEEQILQAQQKELENARAEAQAQEHVTQAVAGTAKMQKDVNEQQRLANEARMNRFVSGNGRNVEDVAALKTQIADILNIQEKEIQMVNIESASYNQLSSYIKQLQDAYKRLGGDVAGRHGTDIADELQRAQRAMQKFQSQMNRPTSLKSALGLDEKTLDDIAYKMRQLQSYKMGLNITDPKALNEMEKVDKEVSRLKKQYDDLMGKNNQMVASNTALGRSWNYMKNRLAFYFTVGASTQFVNQLVAVRGQYELLERSIGILIDSAQQGSQIFAELNSMAIKSPFTTMELGAAAKQLVAYDVAAKDVVDTTRRLADMAAAVGIPIERLTYALGQIKAYGYLNARDARMFANAGIPLVKELADRYTELEGRLVSTADVYDRIKKKAISYEDVMSTVNSMTDEGGRFFNFQEKAADTLKVKIANLTLAWNNFLNEVGKSEQGIISGGLKITKDVLESWRSFFNLVSSIIINIGLLKAATVLYLTVVEVKLKKNLGLWAAMQVAIRKSLGAAVLGYIRSIGSAIASLANPLTLAAIAVTALGIALTKLMLDYKDIKNANDALNKSFVDNANENIKSVEKFFDDYNKQLANVGSLNQSDQQKLWERLQEEIEKTTKNADEYIIALERIENVSDRIGKGKEVLEQSKRIQEALKELADKGTFNVGGGFADDTAAKNLQEYQKILNEITKEYGSVSAAAEEYSMKSRKMIADYSVLREETQREIDNLVSKLDGLYMPDILGDSNDVELQLANLRSVAESWRDTYLATEEGSKIGTDGIARINASLDKWIVKQAKANGLLRDENGLFNEQRAEIEKNKTAWQEFFRFVSGKDRERIDAAIKSGNASSNEVKKIWDKAAAEMEKRSTTSYELIKDQISNLRETPEIVIDVVYRERVQKSTDKQIESYKNDLLAPQSSDFKKGEKVTIDKYLEASKKRTEKYGKFIKKEGEDNVEWEKRLGEQYQANIKNIKSLNDQIDKLSASQANGTKVSEADLNAKKKQREELVEDNKTLKELEKREGFNYDQFKKGGKKKDPVLDALKLEISLIEKLRGDYDKLTKAGESRQNALSTITSAYGKTISQLNRQLESYGLPTIDLTELIVGKDPNAQLQHFKKTLETLINKGMMTLERSKELEAALEKLTISAKTYDLDMITKGLNNELGKLKDEYELAVELDADPELSDAFLNVFGIDKSALSSSIDDYMFAVQDEFRKKSQELGYSGWGIDVFKANEDTWKEWGGNAGLSDEALDKFKAKFVEAQNVVKKVVQDTVKQTKDLEYKLSDAEGKIAIETTKLKKMQADREIADQKSKDAALTEEQRSFFASQKQLLDLQIQDQEEKIARLGDEVLQMLPTYKNLFNSIVEHSDYATRQIAKQWKKALENAVQNPNGTYTITDPNDKSKTTTISKKQYGTEVGKADKELRKGMSTFKQIKEAFKKGEDGTVDWAKGIDLLGGEIGKVGGIVSSIGDFAEKMGFSRETVETINDVANSLNGVSNMAQGISQIASGDYIGGAMSVLSGVMTVVSTWMDNADNKIDDKIKESEKTVKKLENQVNILKNSYDALSDSTSRAYGLQVQGTELAMRSNQKLQLQMYQMQMIEKRRQLQLEKSKSSKSRDEDKINDLQSEIISLQGTIDGLVREVANAISDITDDLLGISRGSWAEDFSNSIIDALKSGEDYMKVFNESFDDMVNNMIMKLVATEIVGKWFKENVLDKIDNLIEQRTKLQSDQLAATRQWEENVKVMSGSGTWYSVLKNDPQYIKKFLEEQQGRAFSEEEWAATYKSITDVLGQLNWASQYGETFKNWYLGFFGEWSEDMEESLELATQNATFEAYNSVLKDQNLRESGEAMTQMAKDMAEALGISGTDKNLSALQQGLQSMSEDTGSALEAYMNGVSQQVYLHSDLLTQIRDAVVGMDMDVQNATQAQMLLQLQNNYIVMQSMQSMMENWTVPSGNGIRVELLS